MPIIQQIGFLVGLRLRSPWVCVLVPPLLGSVLLGFKAQNWAEGLEEGVSILDIMSARVDKRRNATGSWAKITDLLPTNHNGVTGKKILGATRFKATTTNHIYIVIRTLSRISFSSCLAKHFQISVKVESKFKQWKSLAEFVCYWKSPICLIWIFAPKITFIFLVFIFV